MQPQMPPPLTPDVEWALHRWLQAEGPYKIAELEQRFRREADLEALRALRVFKAKYRLD